MNETDFRNLAISSVVQYFNMRKEKTDELNTITSENVFVVWQCKTLQNNKAMLSTTVFDGMYYEFTWNGDKEEGYLDAYKKWDNVIYKFEDAIKTEKVETCE